jgi:hypothetical protein
MDDIVEFSDSEDDNLLKENSDPTTSNVESIVNNNFNFYKLKYKHIKETNNVSGYVVNVHDCTNFDIDLNLSSTLQKKYKDVITNQYKYYDFNKYFFDNINIELTKKLVPKIGNTYRCRLRGIGMKQTTDCSHIWKINQISIDVKKLIDINDGWITCTLSDVDVYQRLLIDVYIKTVDKTINLCDYLLEKMCNDTNPIFYKYNRNDKYS